MAIMKCGFKSTFAWRAACRACGPARPGQQGTSRTDSEVRNYALSQVLCRSLGICRPHHEPCSTPITSAPRNCRSFTETSPFNRRIMHTNNITQRMIFVARNILFERGLAVRDFDKGSQREPPTRRSASTFELNLGHCAERSLLPSFVSE